MLLHACELIVMADADESFDKLVRRQNRKKKKSGGFQSMGTIATRQILAFA